MPTLTLSRTVTSIIPPGGEFTFAAAINDPGEVVGNCADRSDFVGFIDDQGTFTTLNGPSASLVQPGAINDRGDVAGHSAAARKGPSRGRSETAR
jgi:hypothetical protein